MDLAALVESALDRRAQLLERLGAEGTDAYRIFHGSAEGREGLAIDRYGPLILVQSFREPLEEDEGRALEPRTFDLVFLDPPAWAKGPFGAVDLERDYPALFKPALIATAPGGAVIATNHVASVDLDAWIGVLRRSAEKSGRPLAGIETIAPDEDFPARDGRPPLKIAVCRAPH